MEELYLAIYMSINRINYPISERKQSTIPTIKPKINKTQFKAAKDLRRACCSYLREGSNPIRFDETTFRFKEKKINKENKKLSRCRDQTRVIRVTGENTYHYTTTTLLFVSSLVSVLYLIHVINDLLVLFTNHN